MHDARIEANQVRRIINVSSLIHSLMHSLIRTSICRIEFTIRASSIEPRITGKIINKKY